MTSPTAVEIRATSRSRSAADHSGSIRAYYPFWDAQYRPYLRMAVEALPLEQFDFKPRPEVFTAREMIVHIAEAERWWTHHIVEGEPYEDWVVPHEDKA